MKKSLNLCLPLFASFMFLIISLYSVITLFQWHESQCYIKDLFDSNESYELYGQVKTCEYRLYVSVDSCQAISDYNIIIPQHEPSCNDHFTSQLYQKYIQCYYDSDCNITLQSMDYSFYTILLLVSFASLCYTLTYIHYLYKSSHQDDIIPMEII